jgi:hypothetical protein
MSSLQDYSIPTCVLIDTYHEVPVNPLPSLYLIWSPLEFLYFLANPKSTKNILSY